MLRLRHIFTTTSTTMIGGGLTLLVTLLIAKLLPPLQNGHYSQFSLVFNLYYILINFGLGPASTYFISSGQVDEKQIIITNIKILFFIAILSLSLIILLEKLDLWYWIESQLNIPKIILLFGILTGILLLIFNQCTAILMGKKFFDTVNVLNLLKAALPFPAIGIAMLVLFDETGFALATMSAFIVLCIISTWFVLRSISYKSFKLQKKTIGMHRSILRYSGIVYASNVLHYIAMRGLLMIISYNYAPEYVGFFNIALVLLDAALIIPSAVGQLLFPQSSSPQFNYDLTEKIIRLNIYVGLLTIIGVILLTPISIGLLLGSNYQPAGVAFIHLAPSILLLAVPRILSQILSGQGHPEYPLCAAIISFFLGGFVAFWCIPIYGIIGAAWVINFVSAITAIVTVYGYTRLRGVGVIEIFCPKQSDFYFASAFIPRQRGNK